MGHALSKKDPVSGLANMKTKEDYLSKVEDMKTKEDSLSKVETMQSRPDPLSKIQIQDLETELRKLQTDISPFCKSEPLRIVLCGPVGAGKSSLVNTIVSAFRGKVVVIANVGTADESITSKYLEYKIRFKEDPKTYFVLCDTQGVDKVSPETQSEALKAAVKGTYISDEKMDNIKSGDQEKGSTGRRERAVYIIFVDDATKVISDLENTDERSRMIKGIQMYAHRESIPMSIFLTKCDRLDKDVSKDVQKLYISEKVEEARNYAHQKFNGWPKNRIFPIVNYTDQMEAEPPMRLQIFYALKHIVGDVESYMSESVRDA